MTDVANPFVGRRDLLDRILRAVRRRVVEDDDVERHVVLGSRLARARAASWSRRLNVGMATVTSGAPVGGGRCGGRFHGS